MYDIFTYIWLIFMVHVVKYTIHESYGIYIYTTTPLQKKGRVQKDRTM